MYKKNNFDSKGIQKILTAQKRTNSLKKEEQVREARPKFKKN